MKMLKNHVLSEPETLFAEVLHHFEETSVSWLPQSVKLKIAGKAGKSFTLVAAVKREFIFPQN